MWIIRNKLTGLYWSNDWGWGSLEGCDQFQLGMTQEWNLPLDGEWIKL